MELEDISFEGCIGEICDCLRERYERELVINDAPAFKEILSDTSLSITKKKAALKKAASVSKSDRQLSAMIDALSGGKVKASDVCDSAISGDADVSFSFKGDYENTEAQLRETLGDDMQLIDTLKKLYDWSLLEKLRNGEQYISAAKVKVYEQHKADLKRLKNLFRLDKKLFNEMFRVARDKLDNYPAYSGHRAENYRCDYAQFCTYARKQLKALMPGLDGENTETAQLILEALEAGTFLPKQTDKDNGVLPHQLHEQELKHILDNASVYLPFLNDRDESGLSRKEQILEIFRFRVPYYVGPLNPSSKHSWIVRTAGKITPWNFENIVDIHASAENFINRMTATCSYIGEPVLPKDSLLYSKFVALNVINKIHINGHPISVDTKQKLFDRHILPNGKASYRSIKNHMISEGMMNKSDTLGGIDEMFKITLTGYQVFRQLLAGGSSEAMIEDIIKHLTLYGEDRRLLAKWLEKEYREVLSPADISYIIRSRSRFNGWGNLSHEFLTGIEHIDDDTGEIISIIDALWNTNHNLMELLSGQFAFADNVQKWRDQKYGGKKRTLDDVLDDSYASPGIRRAIHQVMALISEIEKIMDGRPRRVFVEVTRGEGEKERTVSRKKQLDDLYAHCKNEAPDVYALLQGCDEAQLRSAKYYLYFTQLGKCMYSGEPIDIARLSTDYDIDHIYPQSRVKDDSFGNRVLVRRTLNAAKSDTYPIPDDIRSRMKGFWGMLKARGLITEEKYRRLTRNTSFSDHELSGFIARQLVETSQSCKIVTELLKNRYGDNDRVVYVKAGNISSFRQDQRLLPDGTPLQAGACKGVNTLQDPLFIKCREVNDFHHAKDAYLNIVVGNVYHVKFTRNPVRFIQGKHTYSMNRMFDFDVVRNDETAWTAGNDGSIATVRRMMAKNNILFTRYARRVTGGLFDQQLLPKGKGQAMIKSSDPRLTVKNYGGYNKLTGAYFTLVEHTEKKKKKRMRSLETVFLLNRALYERDPVGYCEQILGLVEPRILIRQIKIDSLVSLDGFRMHISGRTGNQILYKNANQLVLSPRETQYVKQIGKYLERCRNARADLEITAFDGITAERNREIYDMILNKLCNARYSVKYATPAETIRSNYDQFLRLSPADQCRILMQLFGLLKANAASADLKLLCGKAGIGILLTSKNMINLTGHDFKLINQSVTGFFEQETDLLGDGF